MLFSGEVCACGCVSARASVRSCSCGSPGCKRVCACVCVCDFDPVCVGGWFAFVPGPRVRFSSGRIGWRGTPATAWGSTRLHLLPNLGSGASLEPLPSRAPTRSPSEPLARSGCLYLLARASPPTSRSRWDRSQLLCLPPRPPQPPPLLPPPLQPLQPPGLH